MAKKSDGTSQSHTYNVPPRLRRRDFLLASVSAAAAYSISATRLAQAQAKLTPPSRSPGTTYTIDVSGASTGSHSANSFTGWKSPTTTVTTAGDGLKYIKDSAATGLLTAWSTATCLDGEVTSYFADGAIFLRATDAGAIYLYRRASSNTLRIGFFYTPDWGPLGSNDHFFGAIGPQSGSDFYRSTSASTDLGLGTLDGTSTITLGCSGLEIYLKVNGTEVLRFRQWKWNVPGSAAFFSNSGARDVSFTPAASDTVFYSDFAGSPPALDARDFGMRNITPAVGSIFASSSSLVLASNPGFVAGDTVIVEIGTESGVGARGTEGVGGHWPDLDYPDFATMSADLSQSDTTWAAALDTHLVYVYDTRDATWYHNGGSPTKGHQGYYSEFIIPKSLVSQVKAVSGDGLTLTLANSAVATATNANVYLDCTDSFWPLVDFPTNAVARGSTMNVPFALPTPNIGTSFSIPAGTYCTTQDIAFGRAGYNFTRLEIFGQGRGVTTIKAPYGTMGASIFVAWCNGYHLHDLTFRGNFGPDKFGFDFQGATGANSTSGRIRSESADNVVFQQVDSVDCFGGMSIATGDNGSIYQCIRKLTSGVKAYTGWGIALVGISNGEIRDCFITCPKLYRGFEVFAAYGSPSSATSSAIRSCGGYNIAFSTNSTDNFTLDSCWSIIEANTYENYRDSSLTEAVFNISANAFKNTIKSGTVSNCSVTQLGYVDGLKETLRHLEVAPDVDGIVITGGYGSAPCPVAKTYGGCFSGPGYVSGATNWGSSIIIGGDNCSVNGVSVVGLAQASPGHAGGFSNIDFRSGAANGSVTNCIADDIRFGPSQSGNMTTAQYADYCASSPGPGEDFR